MTLAHALNSLGKIGHFLFLFLCHYLVDYGNRKDIFCVCVYSFTIMTMCLCPLRAILGNSAASGH